MKVGDKYKLKNGFHCGRCIKFNINFPLPRLDKLKSSRCVFTITKIDTSSFSTITLVGCVCSNGSVYSGLHRDALKDLFCYVSNISIPGIKIIKDDV